MTRTSSSRTISALTLAWAALALALAHLALVLITELGPRPAPLLVLRTLLSVPILFAPGLPLALLLGDRGRAGRPLGAFSLLALALGFSLVLDYCVIDVARSLAPPVSGRLLSLTALVGAGAALLLLLRWRALRVGLEPGLSPWPLLAALALITGFAIVAHSRLGATFDRLVLLPSAVLSAARPTLRDPRDFKPTFVGGAAHPAKAGWRRLAGPQALYKLSNADAEPALTLVGFAVTAPPGTELRLDRLPAERCSGAGSPASPAQLLAVGRVAKAVAGLGLPSSVKVFNAVVAAPLELSPGETCLALRVLAADRGPVTFAEVSGDLFHFAPRLGGRLHPAPKAAIEGHLSGLAYRASMARSNAISPNMLLWGYFAQFVMEQLAGHKGLAQGATFLLFCLLTFCAALLMIGAVARAPSAEPGSRRQRLVVGLLLLGPLLTQVYGLTYIKYRSFAFPDTVYTGLIVAAIAMLTQRNRLGFILLGCLGAFARYPGAYLLVAALIAWLIFNKEDRAWTRRTLLWAAGSGLLVLALLLAHFHSTMGVGAFVTQAYYEVFPEHFEVLEQASPAWQRVACFFVKLSLLSGLTVVFWPLVRDAAGKLLIAVTLAYALTLMMVHVPHLHYYPILFYCAAAAGLRAVAMRGSLRLAALAAVLVVAGVVLIFGVDLPWCTELFARYQPVD